jgi:preprotein translocase subunit Sss1
MDILTSIYEGFKINPVAEIPILGFIINIIMASMLSLFLSYIYNNYGNSLSNRRSFSKNFLLLTTTTMLVITIVKSSLALSLGLVGALSIVRFRAAIKEPEELSYLFIAIVIGLGFGANQGFITLIGFIVIILMIFIKNYTEKNIDDVGLYISITSKTPKEIDMNIILEVLKQYCDSVDLKRLDETSELFELVCFVNFIDHNQVKNITKELKKIDSSIQISLMDRTI